MIRLDPATGEWTDDGFSGPNAPPTPPSIAGMAQSQSNTARGYSDPPLTTPSGYSSIDAGNQAYAQQIQARNQQQAALGLLRGAAEGTAPSAAQNQLYQGLRGVQSAQQAAAASTRGGNMGLAQYNAQQAGAQAAAQTNAQAAILRAQEMAAARGQYFDAASGIRGGDIQENLGQAGVNNQGNANLIQSQIGNRNADQAFGRDMTQIGAAGLGAAGTLGAGALMGPRSDIRLKTDIHDGSDLVRALMDKSTPHAWRYRDPATDGAGEHAGPMAQELEQTELGKAIVHDSPRGKMIDQGSAITAILAGLGDLHARLKRIEGHATTGAR